MGLSNVTLSVFLILILLVGNSGCDSERYFEETKTIENGSWDLNNKAVFSVVIQDTSAIYNFYLTIRNDLSYPYSNLYLFLTTVFPNGQTARDTIECMLAEPDGEWLGTGMGRVKFNRFLFQKGVRFRFAGTYRFELEQAMRMDELHGILDVGIRIEKNNLF